MAALLVLVAAGVAGYLADPAKATTPPANVNLPSISGGAATSEVLTAVVGAWDSPTAPTYTYQWYRCNSAGASCVSIGSATASTYTVVTADVGGTLRVTVTATNAWGSSSAQSPASVVVQGQAVPVGAIVAYGGTTLPSGWLWANGAAVSRATYADLFAVTGTTYGTGDGSTTFNVPDLDQRFALGKAAAGTGSTLGGTGGAIDHTHSAPSLASHSHTATFSTATHSVPGVGHSHTFSAGTNYPTACCSSATLAFVSTFTTGAVTPPATTSTAAGGATVTLNAGTQSVSSVTTANPPFLTVNYLVKATTQAALPCGALWGTGRSTAPAGAALANGAAVSRSTWSATFGCIGTTFGAGDGSTTFNLPNTTGRYLLGKAAAGTGATLGSTGGSMGHTHTANVAAGSHSFTRAAHTHSATQASHTHGNPAFGSSGNHYQYDAAQTYGWITNYTSAAGGNVSATSSSAGGGTATSSTNGAQAVPTSVEDPPFQAVHYGMYQAATSNPDAGMIVGYAGSTAPPGWLLANGGAVSRSTEAGLFSAIGTSFGAGDGSTTFNLPNLAQRFALGRAAAGTGSTLGSTGGTIDHTPDVTVAAHTHTATDIAHTHTVTYGSHSHNYTLYQSPGYCLTTCGTPGSGNAWWGGWAGTSITFSTNAGGGGTVTTGSGSAGTVTSTSAGGSTVTAGANNPPFLAINNIVRRDSVDTSAPAAVAYVNDGGDTAGAVPDTNGQGSTTTLNANWAGVTDVSGILRYEYCMSTLTNCAGTIVAGWTDNGTATTVTRSGLSLTLGGTYYTCVRSFDEAGNAASAVTCSNGVTIDNIAPPPPATVNDGSGADIFWNTSPTQVQANWSVAVDTGGSGLNRYEYCISATTSCGGTPVVSWTSTGTTTSVTHTGLSLTQGTTYYVCVRTYDNAGWVSLTMTCSNGQRVDSVIGATSTVNDGTGADVTYTQVNTQLAANWTAVADATSGLARYDYCISATTNCGGTPVVNWTTNGTSTSLTRTGLSLTDGQVYYWCVRAVDNAGNVGAVVCSNGQQVDITRPGVPTVADGAGADIDWSNVTSSFTGNWTTVTDIQSGLNRYEYCISATTNCGGTPVANWTTNLLATNVTRGSLSLASGTTYYICIRTFDNAGWQSSTNACSDGLGIDTVAPVAPGAVYDGSDATDDVWNASATQSIANWTAGSDALSGVNRYEYCISTATNCGGTIELTWTSNALALTRTQTGMTLNHGQIYYWCVRTVDNAGNTTSRCSNGQTVDVQTPASASIADGTGADIDYVTSLTTLSANWGAVTDPHSGLNRYETCFSTATSCGGTVVSPWTTAGTATTITRSSLTLSEATAYYACVRAIDALGNVSSLSCSDAQTTDTQAPAAPAATNDGSGADIDWTSSSSQLQANWSAVTDTSGVQRYEYCISTVTSCGGTPIRSWTSAGASTSVTANSLTLVDNTMYYTCVRVVDNMNFTGAMRCSDGQRTDIYSPSLPILVTPVDDAAMAPGSVLFTATYRDPLPGSPGQLDFQLCTTWNCSAVSQSGSSASGLATGSNGTWTATGVVANTYYWRVRGRDSTGATSAWTTTRRLNVTNPPNVPPLVSPADATWVTVKRPLLTATFQDTDPGASGRLTFELCRSDPADPWTTNCASGFATGMSPSGLAHNANGAWAPNSDLVEGATYWWRARATDQWNIPSAFSGSRSFQVDTVAPPRPLNIAVIERGLGAIKVGWSATTDPAPGSGGVVYDMEYSTDGVTWPVACDDITTLDCQQGGLGGATRVFFRIRACDAAGNCSSWGYLNGTSGDEYFLRWADMSSILGGAANREATIPPLGIAQFNTSVKHGSTDGWYIFRPGQTDSIVRSATEPPDQPWAATGTGWVIDDYAGKVADGGPMRIRATILSTHSQGTALLQCRAWKVTTDGAGTITPFPGGAQFLGKQTLTTDMTTGNALPGNYDCNVTGLATQTTFTANEAIYVELWYELTSGVGPGTQQLQLSVEGNESYIEAPKPGSPPNLPTLVSPVGGTVTTTTPTFTAGYSHPGAVQGSLLYEVSTDPTFATVTETGVSALIASGTNGTFMSTGLAPATTYYWRVKAFDEFNRSSAWTGNGTFSTNSPPNTPTNLTPIAGGVVAPGPVLTSSAFSDPNGSQTHGASEWEVRTTSGSYSVPVAASGTTAVNLTSWAPAGLATGETYFFHVRYRDSFGTWSDWSAETSFRVQSPPALPTTLEQWSSDGNTQIAVGGATDDGPVAPVQLKFTIADPDAGDLLTPWVEVRPNTTPFSGSCGTAGAGMYSGAAVTASVANTGYQATVPVTGLATGQLYHWRACVRDQDGNTSAWAMLGGSPDFRINGVLAMSVDSLSPSSATQSRTGLVVQVNGSQFVNGATVAFSGTGITITNTTFVSSTRIDVTITISSSATLGARNVTVTNPDLSNATLASGFTVLAPTQTISLSVLGYGDASRDSTAPLDLSWGLMSPGATRTIGPAASGQATPGAAVEVTRTSDSNSNLLVSATAMTSGGNTVPVGNQRWRTFGTANPWNALTTTNATVASNTAPGTTTNSFDLQLQMPAGQAVGTYSGTITWTVIPSP